MGSRDSRGSAVAPRGPEPGARWPTKRWPPEHFAEIGRRAVDEFGAGLIAVGSAADRPLVDGLMRRITPIPVLDLCGRTRLMELAALAVESDLLVSNDTGPLHLAAASGARVVGIYTCTSPALTGPFGPVRPRFKAASGVLPAFSSDAAGSTAWRSLRRHASGQSSRLRSKKPSAERVSPTRA